MKFAAYVTCHHCRVISSMNSRHSALRRSRNRSLVSTSTRCGLPCLSICRFQSRVKAWFSKLKVCIVHYMLVFLLLHVNIRHDDNIICLHTSHVMMILYLVNTRHDDDNITCKHTSHVMMLLPLVNTRHDDDNITCKHTSHVMMLLPLVFLQILCLFWWSIAVTSCTSLQLFSFYVIFVSTPPTNLNWSPMVSKFVQFLTWLISPCNLMQMPKPAMFASLSGLEIYF